MATAPDKPLAVLVLTGPARDRLAKLFRRLYAGRDVRVVVDRRVSQRRRAAGAARRAPQSERRRGERRRSSPWLVFPSA